MGDDLMHVNRRTDGKEIGCYTDNENPHIIIM